MVDDALLVIGKRCGIENKIIFLLSYICVKYFSPMFNFKLNCACRVYTGAKTIEAQMTDLLAGTCAPSAHKDFELQKDVANSY